ncbi:MAG: hypothetical protein HDQ99_13205 [Lachnospiraceae bacterium]|nr:hypothetical protein [Lachnospiraceae bacterium]
MKYESKIIGINLLWISALLTGTFLIVCATGGDNINWGYLGFEVIFPFYTSIVIGEWCKTRTDPLFDVISSQGHSFFGWLVRRFVLLFGSAFIFAFIGMIGVSLIRQGNSIFDMIFTFLPTAFALSSSCVFISLLSGIPHISTMTAGLVWLFSIMAMSLLRVPLVQYFYLFARYAGINSPLWIVNKIILLSIGIVFWISIFLFCKKRIWQ